MRMVDRIWEIAMWMPILLGSTANKYLKTKQLYFEHEKFPYYDFELPDDNECDDLANKQKWLNKYRKWGDLSWSPLELKRIEK